MAAVPPTIASDSRIAALIQPLDLNAEGSSGIPMPLLSGVGVQRTIQPGATAADVAPVGTGGDHERRDEDDEDEGGEDDEWAVAGKSKNAERRRRRKQQRWEARQPADRGGLAAGGEGVEPLSAVAASANADEVAAAAAKAMQEDDEDEAAAAASGRGEGERKGNDGDVQEDGLEEGDEAMDEGDEDEDEFEEEEVEEEEEEESDDEDQEGSEEGDVGGAAGSEVGTDVTGTTGTEFHANTTSSVLSLTGDFAMQNVLLQMGLRLVSREGQQITR
jgi:RNA-binding protein NOB1